MSKDQAIISRFGLDYEQTKIMFSMQYLTVQEDIYFEKNEEKKRRKNLWLYNWKKSIESYLESLDSRDDKSIYKSRYCLHEYISQIEELFTKYKIDKFKAYLILLEVSLFRPYYPLEMDIKEKGLLKKTELLLDRLELTSIETFNRKCRFFAQMLGVNSSYVSKFNNSYEKSIRGISKFWDKVVLSGLAFAVILALTAGLAATAIAPFFAPAGLHGAAAISAGLAALGGGAIAVGGYGMAGGMTVLVGGGAIIGAASGSGFSVLFSSQSDFTLLQVAKLEVVFTEIILGIDKNIELAQEIISQQRMTVESVEDELFKLKRGSNMKKEKVKVLEKSLTFLKTSLERLKSIE